MQCTLMHKRIPVVELDIDDENGKIYTVGTCQNPAHLPLGTLTKNGEVDKKALSLWWRGRSIPASRTGIKDALERLSIQSTKALLTKCYGLSLSDQYWICPADKKLRWDDVNFFTNPFPKDVGDVLFGEAIQLDSADFTSPDNTSGGNLKKRWRIINGKRYLMKGGSPAYYQQPFNEAIATRILEKLGIPHVPYQVIWSDGKPYSLCEDFVDTDTELFPAEQIKLVLKKYNHHSELQHFFRCCEYLGIPNAEKFFNQMIAFDYIISNEDRHWNNFGAIRNAETLEWVGMAPVFDNGTSLGFASSAYALLTDSELVMKPFNKKPLEVLDFIDTDGLALDTLDGIEEIIREILLDGSNKHMDSNHAEDVASCVRRHIENLKAKSRAQLRRL